MPYLGLPWGLLGMLAFAMFMWLIISMAKEPTASWVLNHLKLGTNFGILGIGVILCQLILGSVFSGTEHTAPQMALVHLMQYPKDVGRVRFNDNPLILAWVALKHAVVRTLCEDLPQCVIQYLFTVNVHRNSFIMFSICISFCSTFLNLGLAGYDYQSAKKQPYTAMTTIATARRAVAAK